MSVELCRALPATVAGYDLRQPPPEEADLRHLAIHIAGSRPEYRSATGSVDLYVWKMSEDDALGLLCRAAEAVALRSNHARA